MLNQTPGLTVRKPSPESISSPSPEWPDLSARSPASEPEALKATKGRPLRLRPVLGQANQRKENKTMNDKIAKAVSGLFQELMLEATAEHEQVENVQHTRSPGLATISFRRCEKHKHIGEYNGNADGPECGACIHDAAASAHKPNPETHNAEDVSIINHLHTLLEVIAGIDTANGLFEAVKKLIAQRNCERKEVESLYEKNRALNVDLGNLKQECERLRKQHGGVTGGGL